MGEYRSKVDKGVMNLGMLITFVAKAKSAGISENAEISVTIDMRARVQSITARESGE